MHELLPTRRSRLKPAAGRIAQCHIVFPLPNICTNRGADPLVCGRRPRRPAGVCLMLISLFRLRDEGVPRGPGGPPSNSRPNPAVAKTKVAHELVRAAPALMPAPGVSTFFKLRRDQLVAPAVLPPVSCTA